MAEFKKLAELLEDTLNNIDRKTLISLEYDDITQEVVYRIIEDPNTSAPQDIHKIAWGLMSVLEHDFEKIRDIGDAVMRDRNYKELEPFIKDNVIAFKKPHWYA